MKSLVSPPGTLIDSDLVLATPGVYSLTIRLPKPDAERVRASLPKHYDTSRAIAFDEEGHAVLTFKMWDVTLMPTHRGEKTPQPPPTFARDNKLVKPPVTLTPGAVVRVSYLPYVWSPLNSAAYYGFEPAHGIYFIALQVLRGA